jgi:hypothetical protein
MTLSVLLITAIKVRQSVAKERIKTSEVFKTAEVFNRVFITIFSYFPGATPTEPKGNRGILYFYQGLAALQPGDAFKYRSQAR